VATNVVDLFPTLVDREGKKPVVMRDMRKDYKYYNTISFLRELQYAFSPELQ
jgi:hypothetical protein